MSNRICITPTEFKDVRTGDIGYGVRIYDDYTSMYLNTWSDIPDDDFDLIARCVDNLRFDDRFINLFDHVAENNSTVWIGNSSYRWEEIKHLFPAEK